MPETEVGIIVKREVAVQVIALMLKPKLKMGTKMVPPPTPRRPESIPTPRPTITMIMQERTMRPLWTMTRDGANVMLALRYLRRFDFLSEAFSPRR